MKNDMITIFNRLTCPELADYKLFKYALVDNYDKFKYLYSLISDINLDKIEDISCIISDTDEFEVRIFVTENSYIRELVSVINDRRHSYKKADRFDLTLDEESTSVTLKIYMNSDSIQGEGEYIWR